MWFKKHQTSVLIALGIGVLFSLFWLIQSLAVIIFVSILMTVLLNPLVDKLCKKKAPRGLAAAAVLLSFVALLAFLLLSVSQTFIPSFKKFVNDLPQITENLKNIPFVHLPQNLAAQLQQFFDDIADFSITAIRSSLSLIVSIFSKALDMVVIFFLTFYLLKDSSQVTRYFVGLFPAKDTARVRLLADRITRALADYIRGQLVVCLFTGVVVFAYFMAVGLPYASVFAVISAVGEFAPVVGPTVASGFGAMLAITESSALALPTLVFYIVLSQLNHNVVFPYLIGRSLHLHPIAIIIGIIFCGKVLGVLGMILAVPCIVIVKLVLEDIAGHLHDNPAGDAAQATRQRSDRS